MAETLANTALPVVDELDFALETSIPTGMTMAAADDYDFDLGSGENEQIQIGETTEGSPVAPADTTEDITYDEDGEDRLEDAGEVEESEARVVDEIDYAEASLEAETNGDEPTEGQSAADAHDGHETTEEQAVEEAHRDIAFDFEEADDGIGYDGQDDRDDVSFHGNSHDDSPQEQGHDHGHNHGDGASVHDRDEEFSQHEDSNEDGEDASMSHAVEKDQNEDGSYDSGDYDENAENIEVEDGSASPYGSTQSGIGQLQSFAPAPEIDTVVTWGDETCPLFKTPDIEDPNMFYLEDYDVLDYPLAHFLQAIRAKIEPYISATDEVCIKVEELGLEFSETTTEALLSQITFHNLLALYSTLLKNDGKDDDDMGGIHLRLTTRPNCALRLKELVSGAGHGLTFADFEPRPGAVDDSSDESAGPDVDDEMSDEDGEGPAEEDGANDVDDEDEDDDEGDGAEQGHGDDEDEYGGEADSDMADDHSEEDGGVDLDAQDHAAESPDAEDDDEIEDGVDEVQFNAYLDQGDNVESYDAEDDVGGLLLSADTQTSADQGTTFDNTADLNASHDESETKDDTDFLADIPSDAVEAVQHDDFDLLQDTKEDGIAVDQVRDSAFDTISNGTEVGETGISSGGNVLEEDDFLDLHGDIADDNLGTNAAETADNGVAPVDDAITSLATSATATADNDEIDYEDINANGNATSGIASNTNLGTEAADEITWEEDPIDAATGGNVLATGASAKRAREDEGDLHDGAALFEGEPDSKRQRPDDSNA